MSGAAIAARLASNLPMILMVLSAIAIGIGAPLAYRCWRDMHEDDEPVRNTDLLKDLERGGAASKMTEDELHRVRELLLGSDLPRRAPKNSSPSEQGGRKEEDREDQTDMASGQERQGI
jgi:hypothetical protein